MVAAMCRPHPSFFVFLLALPLPQAACPDDGAGRSTPDTADTADVDTVDPEVGDDTSADTTPPSDTPDTADTTDTSLDTRPDGELGPPLEVHRFGARMIGAPIQLSVTDTGQGRFLWVGTRGNLVPGEGGSTTPTLRGGLFRYDLATGDAVRFEDELPREDYSEFMALDPLSFGPAPTAGVQADGDRFVVVARTGLLGLSGDSFDQVVVTHDGQPLVPVQLAIARDGLRPVAWMTSNIGLVRLDEDTFTVEAVIRGADLAIDGDTGGDFGRLTVDPDTGAVYAGYYTSDGRSSLVKVGVDNQRRVWLTGTDSGPRGRVGELVFSQAAGKVYAALASWSAADGGVVAWDGEAVSSLVREGPLAQTHQGEVGAFGAHSLALDEVNGVLAVGGQVQSGFGGLKGGGLVLVELGGGTGAPRLLGVAGRDAPLIHWHVQSLAWDTAGRELFIVASDLCNETRLRALGVFGVRFVDGRVVYRRPFLSSLRSLAVVEGRDGAGEVLAGVRDDNGGLACESVPVSSGLGRLEVGGLELMPVVSTSGDLISKMPGVTAMHGDGASLTLGTWRDGFLVGEKTADRVEGFVGNPALIGPSLFLDAVWAREARQGGREVWLAGRTSHQPGDPAVVADRGPRGVAKLEVANGLIASAVHYVRSSEDAEDVVGLPSGDVRDLAANAAGDLVLSCAKERMAPNYDRDEAPVFLLEGQSRGGGLALIPSGDRGVVSVLADHTVTPDPRAVAFAPDGHLWVADAERGVLRSTGPVGGDRASGADAIPREPPDPLGFLPVTLGGWPTGAKPIRLWVGGGSDLAVATSMGLWVRLGGRELVIDGVGFVWSLLMRDGALWAGSDEGLVVVSPEDHAVTLPARTPGEPVPWP